MWRALYQYLLVPFRLFIGVGSLFYILVRLLLNDLRLGFLGLSVDRLRRRLLRDDRSRYDAIEALGRSTDPRATELLLESLESPDRYLAMLARDELKKKKDPAALPGLRQLLSHPDMEIRTLATTVLEDLADPEAVPLLLEAASDREDSYLRVAAVSALGATRDPRAVDPLVGFLEDPDEDSLRAVAALALGRIGDSRAIEPLVRAARDEELSDEAVKALAGIDGAQERLVSMLSDPDDETRGLAARALGECGDSRVIESLSRAVEDEATFVRAEAAAALGKLGDDPRVVPALARALTDERVTVRRAASGAVGRLDDDLTAELLSSAAQDSSADVRASLLDELRSKETQARLRFIARSARDPDVIVRRAAVRALGGYLSVLPRLEHDWTRRDVVGCLGEFTADPAVEVRVAVLAQLSFARDSDEAVEIVAKSLSDPEPDVRAAAARALGRLRCKKARPLLVEALRDRDGRVREGAACALADIHPRQAMDPLLPLLEDPEPGVRAEAARAVGEIWASNRAPHRKPVPLLERLMKDPDPRVAKRASEARQQF